MTATSLFIWWQSNCNYVFASIVSTHIEFYFNFKRISLFICCSLPRFWFLLFLLLLCAFASFLNIVPPLIVIKNLEKFQSIITILPEKCFDHCYCTVNNFPYLDGKTEFNMFYNTQCAIVFYLKPDASQQILTHQTENSSSILLLYVDPKVVCLSFLWFFFSFQNIKK